MKKIIFILVVIFYTNTLHAQWTTLNSGTTTNLNSVFFPSPDTGFVAGNNSNGGEIRVTTDGGLTWHQQYQFANYYDILLTLFFVSDSVGWAGGGSLPNGVIMKTNNAGATWNIQTTNVKQVYSIYFVSDSVGWAVANDGSQGLFFIYKTVDGGSTWTTQKSGSDYMRSVCFVDSLTGWVAGDNGNIYKTVDGGNNWAHLNSGVVFHFTSVFSRSDSTAFAVGHYQYGGFYETSDGGLSWNPQSMASLAYLYSVYFTSADNGWTVGDVGTIMNTVNGGATWSVQASNTNHALNSVHFPDESIGYAVGDSGTILKTENGGVTFINENKISESEISIYPNPASDKITVLNKSNLMVESQISIFNVMGEMVLNEKCLMQNSIEILLDNFEAGVYLLRMQTGDGIVNMKFVIR